MLIDTSNPPWPPSNYLKHKFFFGIKHSHNAWVAHIASFCDSWVTTIFISRYFNFSDFDSFFTHTSLQTFATVCCENLTGQEVTAFIVICTYIWMPLAELSADYQTANHLERSHLLTVVLCPMIQMRERAMIYPSLCPHHAPQHHTLQKLFQGVVCPSQTAETQHRVNPLHQTKALSWCCNPHVCIPHEYDHAGTH
jgi:hypothetical protein